MSDNDEEQNIILRVARGALMDICTVVILGRCPLQCDYELTRYFVGSTVQGRQFFWPFGLRDAKISFPEINIARALEYSEWGAIRVISCDHYDEENDRTTYTIQLISSVDDIHPYRVRPRYQS